MTKEEAIKRLMDEGCKSRLYCELYPDACMKEECEIYMAIKALKGRPKGKWSIDSIDELELSYGGMAYEPVYKCSCCGRVTESYVRFDRPIMPEDADFPNFCGWCGARMKGADDGEN